jgi:DNA-binding transcriptional ArsR family regulator
VTKAEKELLSLDAIFAALAHPSRRQILLILKLRGGTMTAGDIAERFSCKWPTTTRHLQALVDADLISVRKEGRERLYELNAERLTNVVSGWLKWFQPSAPPSTRRIRRSG